MLFTDFSIFSSGGHFVQGSRLILAILVEGHPGNISVKLFYNLATGLGRDVVWRNCLRMDGQTDGWTDKYRSQ